MSEKLDGVRAYWDGTQFISRLGNVFHAPEWFVAELPDDAARRRAVGRPQDVPAHREHRAAPGRSAGVEEAPLRRLRRADARRRLRGAPRPPAARSPRSGTSRSMHACTRTSSAATSLTSARSWRASRRSAARGSCCASRARSTKRAALHAAQGEDVPRRRGARHRARRGHGQAQGPPRRAPGRARGRHALQRRHRLLRRRAREPAHGRDDHHLPLPGALRRRRAALPELRRRGDRQEVREPTRKPKPAARAALRQDAEVTRGRSRPRGCAASR